MTLDETLRTLESMGTAQNRKVYGRHGAGADVIGVSFANLGALKKRIKTDHELALALWAAGPFEARVLATMVADPGRATAAELDEWASDVEGYPQADAVAKFAAGTGEARGRMEKWMAAANEFTAAVGWSVFGLLAGQEGALADDYVAGRLDYVEAHIHGERNRVRHTMNSAVIAIGLRGPEWQELALAAAARIGRVTVDHGETECRTPDAAAYIRKAAGRRKK